MTVDIERARRWLSPEREDANAEDFEERGFAVVSDRSDEAHKAARQFATDVLTLAAELEAARNRISKLMTRLYA